jgi:hypothetical protein
MKTANLKRIQMSLVISIQMILMVSDITAVRAECLSQYNTAIQSYKDKRLLFKPENGSNLLGSVAQSLGATALGVTAGGVVGFILPYAISGVTYTVMATAGTLGTVPAASLVVLSGVAAAVDNENSSKHDKPDTSEIVGFTALLAGAGLAFDINILHKKNSWAPLQPMLNAANSVSSAVIPLTMQYFVPITAAVGGVVGLTVGTRDAILNYKIRGLSKVKTLITTAQEFKADDNMLNELAFFNQIKKLPRSVRKNSNRRLLAGMISELNEKNHLCKDNKPTQWRAFKKLLKDYNEMNIGSLNAEPALNDLADSALTPDPDDIQLLTEIQQPL